MPGTVKSEHLSNADRTNKCDGLEKSLLSTKFTSWQRSLHNSHGIPAVAYGDKRENELINNEARKYGIKTYVHMIDDEDIAMRLENDNVYGLITNSLAPEY